MIGALARWFGYTLPEIDAMTLSDYWVLNKILIRHPPVDILVAAYLGVKPAGREEKGAPLREIGRQNASALSELPRHQKRRIEQMPDFVRSPEMLAVMERVKAEWRTTSE